MKTIFLHANRVTYLSCPEVVAADKVQPWPFGAAAFVTGAAAQFRNRPSSGKHHLFRRKGRD